MAARKVDDPLEQAKMTVEAAPPVPSRVFSKKVVEEPVAPKVEKAPDPVLPVAVKQMTPRYEVLNKVTISWGAGMLKLKPGSIVSESMQGPGSIERMINAGVALKPIAE